MQKHGPVHIWAEFANAREQIINTSPGRWGASSPRRGALLGAAATTPTVSSPWRVPSSQTWEACLWCLRSHDPKGTAFSRLLRFKADAAASVLKKQALRGVCSSSNAWKKLRFWGGVIHDLAYLWVLLHRSGGNCQETPTLTGWNEVSFLTMMVWN